MRRVRVVTDSTADLDPAEAERLGITMVPLRIRWNGNSYRDKVDLSIDDFYRKLKEEQGAPKSSQPPVGEFEEVYRRLLEECEGIVSLHLPAGLSGTVNAARTAALTVAFDRIAVLDTYSISHAIGTAALRVARLAEQGASLAECVALAQDVIPRLRLYCILDTLEFLRRGGRIGRVQAIAGSLLSIKPIVCLEDGVVVPVERVRTMSAAVRRAAELVKAHGALEELAVLYGDEPRWAVRLRDELQQEYPDLEVKLGRTGATVGTHTGPGVVGALFVLAKQGAGR